MSDKSSCDLIAVMIYALTIIPLIFRTVETLSNSNTKNNKAAAGMLTLWSRYHHSLKARVLNMATTKKQPILG